MRINLDIPRAVLEVRTAKLRAGLMARELRKAADAIEKGEGEIDYWISMGTAYGPAISDVKKTKEANTHLGWRSADQVRKERRREKQGMKGLASRG